VIPGVARRAPGIDTLQIKTPAPAPSVMPEQGQQQNDRQRYAEQPKQCTFSEVHGYPPPFSNWKTCGERKSSGHLAAHFPERSALVLVASTSLAIAILFIVWLVFFRT
jgi:hypothetical protein